MIIVLKIFVFLFGITLSFAAVAYFPNAMHPDHPDHCYYEGPPEVKIKLGQTVRDRDVDCGIVTCGTDYTLQWATCGVAIGPDNCRMESDLSLDYPGCCPTPKCDNDNMI